MSNDLADAFALATQKVIEDMTKALYLTSEQLKPTGGSKSSAEQQERVARPYEWPVRNGRYEWSVFPGLDSIINTAYSERPNDNIIDGTWKEVEPKQLPAPKDESI